MRLLTASSGQTPGSLLPPNAYCQCLFSTLAFLGRQELLDLAV